MERRHLIRRAIIGALGAYMCAREFESVLLDPAFFAIFGHFDLTRDEAAIVAEEWRRLTELGYLAEIPRYPDCRKLTETGREFARDPVKMAQSGVFGGVPV